MGHGTKNSQGGHTRETYCILKPIPYPVMPPLNYFRTTPILRSWTNNNHSTVHSPTPRSGRCSNSVNNNIPSATTFTQLW